MGDLVFWSWAMQFHYSQKKRLFLHFLDTKPFFSMKIANHSDKPIRPSESWDQNSFLKPGFGISSNSNHRARIFFNAVALKSGWLLWQAHMYFFNHFLTCLSYLKKKIVSVCFGCKYSHFIQSWPISYKTSQHLV